jgi:hypothetical protein
MKILLLACSFVALGATHVSGTERAPLAAPDEPTRPFRALFATAPDAGGGLSPDGSTNVSLAHAWRLPGFLAAGAFDQEQPGTVGGADPQALRRWDSGSKSITWGPLIGQSLALLAFQHWFRATFEDGTWAATVEGPFWDDYVNSVKGLCCWNDGDKGTTNWLFHPMLGSAAAFVFANNHRDSQLTPPGNNRQYWGVKGKQMLFSFAYSTYFELGPVLSEAAIGNVGLDYSEQTWQDIIVTPTLGTAFSIGEDLLRVYVIDRVDRKNHFWGATLAIFLNPTRSFMNVFALKVPWSGPEWVAARREAEARKR